MIGIYACAYGFSTTMQNRPSVPSAGTIKEARPAGSSPAGRAKSTRSLGLIAMPNARDSFYQAVDRERAETDRRNRLNVLGYLDGACGDPKRETQGEYAAEYDRGYANGALARLAKDLHAEGAPL